VCAIASGAQMDGVCTNAPTGSPGQPTCVAVLCNGNLPGCPTNACNGDAQCAAGYFCAGDGTCKPVHSQGNACNIAAAPVGDCLQAQCRECDALSCVDGFCCGSACALGCEACDQTPGTCTVAPAGRSGRCVGFVCDGVSSTCPSTCTSDAQCASGYHCVAGTCTMSSGQGLGQTCGSNGQCLSGHCVGLHCCDSPCAGICQYCDGSGHCQPAAPGSDPRGGCAGDTGCTLGCTAAGTCAFVGVGMRCDVCKACNGYGRCDQPLADDDACGVISCAALASECTRFADLVSMRCKGTGLCAAPNDPDTCTTMIATADGTRCSGGTCSAGQCVAGGNGVTPPSGGKGGCEFAAGARPAAWWALLVVIALVWRRRAGSADMMES
jgi:hypothetical protein